MIGRYGSSYGLLPRLEVPTPINIGIFTAVRRSKTVATIPILQQALITLDRNCFADRFALFYNTLVFLRTLKLK